MSRTKTKKLIPIFICLFLVAPCWAEAPLVKLETNFGDIVIELFDANSPVTVANFLEYVKTGFYDGLIFHRVFQGFVIQGGGHDADLNMPTPYDPIISESNNGLSNLRGTVAMARMQAADSADSQFFINLKDNNSLDWKDPNDRTDPNDVNDVGYCVFGRVISDMNVINRIEYLPVMNNVTAPDGNTLDNVPRPPGPVIIYKAKILGDIDNDYFVDFNDVTVLADKWLDTGSSDLLKITAADGNTGDWYGFTVAIDANYAIVGAPKQDDLTGAAYIFECNDGIWTQKEKLTASDGYPGILFGGSVSISAGHAIVGAPGDNSNTGSAYIFKYNDANWIQQAKLFAYDGDTEDWFGHSVSISGDCAAVGAWLNDTTKTDGGAAYIFYRNEGGNDYWGQHTRISPDDAAPGDWFGYSVAIHGESVIVGAIGDDPDTDFPDFTGSAYLFRCSGDSWIQQAKLTALDGTNQDRFGRSVSTDGYRVIVGAYQDDDKGNSSGSAYIFEPNNQNLNWDQKAKLTASDGAADDYFGYSVALYSNQVIVGAYGNDDNGSSSGSAYIFMPDQFDPNNNWVQKAKLTAPDAAAGDYFGYSVATDISRHAIFGAYGNDDSGSGSGSAYILKLCPDADLNGDCIVNLVDLAVLADDWLLH